MSEMTNNQAERLAILIEECGETLHKAGKILRHGWESVDPTGQTRGDNRAQLTSELGDVLAALALLIQAGDVYEADLNEAATQKLERLGRYLHCNDNQLFAKRSFVRLEVA